MKGLIAGLLGAVGDAIIHWISFFILKTTTTAHYIARLIFPIQDLNLVMMLIGFIIHLASGCFVGILLVLLFKFLGKDYAYYKGLSLAVAFWILHVVIIPNIINSPRLIIFRTETECIIDLLAHIVYAIIAATCLLKTSENKDEACQETPESRI